jgi:starvation-inducible DNA-binding protein
MEELQKAARVAFASEFSFFLKAQNFHWNVEGMFFESFHSLFGKIYEEVYESIDTFAEQLRGMDAYAPGSLQRFSMLTQIDDENDILDSKQMVIELLNDNEKMVKLLKMVFDLSEQSGEHGFSDFIAGRMDAHRKHGWMLKATLK